MAKIKVMALGGLNENHKNMYVVEVDAQMFILDAGVYEPLTSNFGINHFIPRLDYIEQYADRVKGIFLSSGNRQENGAIKELLKVIPKTPIYGSRPTLNSLKVFFETDKWVLNRVKHGEILDFGSTKVQARRVTSSMPGAFSWIFNTEDGNIVYQVNSIFDHIKEFKKADEETMIPQIEGKTLLLMSDSKNANIEGSISPKYRITRNASPKIERATGRTIAVIYEDEIMNIVEMIEIARKFNKKVSFSDKQMAKVIKGLMESEHIDSYPVGDKLGQEKDEIVIFTGTRTNLFPRILVELVEDEDSEASVSIKENDLLIFAAPAQSGNEHVYQTISNEVSRIECELIEFKTVDKPSIHPTQFDLINFIRFVDPKAVMPIKGYYMNQLESAKASLIAGLESKDVHIMDNGEILTIENGKILGVTENLTKITGQTIIEESSDGGIDSRIISERETLAENGLVTIGVMLDKETKAPISDIDIQMKGVVFIKSQDKLLDQIKSIMFNAIEEEYVKNKANLNKVISLIKKQTEKEIKRTTRKSPLLIIDIHEN